MNPDENLFCAAADKFGDYITDLLEPLDTPQLIDLLGLVPYWMEDTGESLESAGELARALFPFIAERLNTDPKELREDFTSYCEELGEAMSEKYWAKTMEYFHSRFKLEKELEKLTQVAQVPTPSGEWEKGAILVSTWGYDQTNVDFYQVTRTSDHSIWARPIGQVTISETRAGAEVMPVPSQFTGKEFRRRRPVMGYINSGDHGLARLWSGEPVRSSSYA